MMILEFYLDKDPPSVNFHYRPKVNFGRGGAKWASLYKDESVAKFQEEIKNLFLFNIKDINLPPVGYISKIITYYIFGVPKDRYWERDLSNFVKIIEDALFGIKDSVFPYDDSHVTSIILKKVQSEHPFIYVKVGLLMLGEEDDNVVLSSFLNEVKNID